MFKYCLVSDLHLDHPQPKTPPLEQFVIVAGDTANGLLGLTYLNKLKRKGHTVFAVEGNHEHYANASQNRLMKDTTEQFYDGLDQVQVRDIPEHKLRIIGCCGWYTVTDDRHWKSYMNDSRHMACSADQMNWLAKTHAQWLEYQLCDIPEGWKAIVVTHMAPCEESLDPRYEGSASNEYYFNPMMTPLLGKFADRIAIWHHGHTHAAVDVVKDGVHIVTNPRGYPSENPEWKPLVIEL